MTIAVTHSTTPDASFSATGAAAWSANHTLTGVGTMAEQDANNVNITGGSISGVTGLVSSVSGTSPISSTGGTTPAISISQAGASSNGYLSSTDWNTFNNKQPAGSYLTSVTADSPLSGAGTSASHLVIAQATTSTSGYLSSTDWNTFNGKAPATSGTSILYGNGSGGFSNVTIGSGISFTGGTLSATGTGGDVVGPSSATDNALARFNTTTGKLIQNSVVVVNDAGTMSGVESLVFDGSVPAVTTTPGTLWFDSSTDTLNLQQNAITQQIGEEIYVYGKASNTITGETLLQAIVKTGVVGASGVITFGVAGAGVTDAGTFIGVGTENIATNSFGRVTNFGIVHGVNTTGSTYGETWVDGQDIWYNPTTGGLTKTKPVAPNIKVQLGTVINAGPGGSGSFQVLIGTGSELGGTDSNVQITTPASGNVLMYNGTYWYNSASVGGGVF